MLGLASVDSAVEYLNQSVQNNQLNDFDTLGDDTVNINKIQSDLGEMTKEKVEVQLIKYLKRENLDLSG